MKSIVLCEPNFGGQSKEGRAADKTNKNGIKNEEAKKISLKDDSLLSVEICQLAGNAVIGEKKTDMRKNESNNEKTDLGEKEEYSLEGNCASDESVEAANGSSETFNDEEEIEILSCNIKKEDGISENSKSLKDDILEKSNESSTGDSNSLSNSVSNSGEVDIHENEVRINATVEYSEPCTSGKEHMEEVNEGEEQNRKDTNESESDCVLLEVNTGEGKLLVDSDISRGKINDDKVREDFDAIEVVRDKQPPDEAFIEEEENKENRSNEGLGANDDTKALHKDNNGTPVVECVESTWDSEERFSEWNGEKTESHGSLENNGEECLTGNDIYLDEIETSSCEKNVDERGKDMEYIISENGNVALGSREHITCLNKTETIEIVECCPDLNKEESELVDKLEEEMIQKRKRHSVDEEDLVESSMKKRRMENKEIVSGNYSGESCHDYKSNEKDCENVETDRGAFKKNALEESIDRVASAQTSLPFLESLRGTIKTLSRSDLEELIVQKLCEVITERSTVGDLRKKAQALEQDQERWKEKVHSLTKQLREMDMVMKKYLSEVQKQNRERNFQMVTPLRITRSVGLQVSFGTTSSKLNKLMSNNTHLRQPLLQTPEKVVKQPSQPSISVSQNVKKNVPILPSPPSKKPAKEQKSPCAPKLGVNVTFQARLISPQAAVTSNRTLQTQHINTINRPRMPVTDQSNSKIIDLTEDDDRQNSQTSPKAVPQPGVTVRPPSQIRVVNHIQPAQGNSGGRVAYFVPATTAAGGNTVPQQGRQLLIATPTVPPPPRQLLPSVPPLLYKGSTILQPGAPQSTLINQHNRTLMPKKLKHPAPLPQPPANQIQKPNLKLLPPRPALKISKVQTGIVLSWNMTLGPEYEPIASYQLYAYQENNGPPATSLWKKVGDVKALPLPMACTLTQFMSGHKYHFAVRAVDLHSRIGPFSFPGSIVLIK